MRSFENLLEDWRDWPILAEPILVRKYTEGLNHETGLLKSGRDHFVLKRFLSGPERQIESQLWAASLGVAPEVIFAPPSHEYMLMQALAEEPLNDEKIDGQSLTAIAESLSVMHNAKPGPRSVNGFNIIEFCQSYLNGSDQRAQDIHTQVMPILKIFQNDSTPWVFCHNDLVQANCFIHSRAAYFIDWEYADLHNPWFDLAAIILYFKLCEERSAEFLCSYDARFSAKSNEPIFFASQVALLWGDILWHLDKYGEDYWPKLAQKAATLESLARQMGLKIA